MGEASRRPDRATDMAWIQSIPSATALMTMVGGNDVIRGRRLRAHFRRGSASGVCRRRPAPALRLVRPDRRGGCRADGRRHGLATAEASGRSLAQGHVDSAFLM